MSLEQQPRQETGQRTEGPGPVGALQRFQEFNKIGLLGRRQVEREQLVIVIHDREEVGGTAVMKVRRMLPEST